MANMQSEQKFSFCQASNIVDTLESYLCKIFVKFEIIENVFGKWKKR